MFVAGIDATMKYLEYFRCWQRFERAFDYQCPASEGQRDDEYTEDARCSSGDRTDITKTQFNLYRIFYPLSDGNESVV